MNPWALVIAAAIAATGAWQTQNWRYGKQLAEIRATQAENTTAAVKSAMDKTVAMQSKKDEAIRDAQIRETALRADVRAVAAQRNGLRNELATARRDLPGASCDSVRGYAKTVNTVFEQCTARLEGLAGETQGIASDALMLIKAWPN